ncbi:MAG: WXG100 family type VII secretion target [Nocardioidaceae bacterium]|nr:WXG100 family type VII secretion target [Nocardioidaceae bacterium]MCL2613222.1 WXG100 family type VII secretion target [Nocardioidaceae bacterium]
MAGNDAAVFGQAKGVLSDAANYVIQAKADLEKQARTLDDQINALRGKWAGDGGNAFFILHNAWQEKHKVIVTALDKFHASLTATQKDNEQVDAQAGDFMNQLINKLGNVQG